MTLFFQGTLSFTSPQNISQLTTLTLLLYNKERGRMSLYRKLKFHFIWMVPLTHSVDHK